MSTPVTADAPDIFTPFPDPAELRELLPKVELVETDDIPMETFWHRKAMNLMLEVVAYHWDDREDFFAGGNMFIYFTEAQARDIAENGDRATSYRGPDFFVVKDVNRRPMRLYWVVWQENGRYPNVITELLSPSTARVDRTIKKRIYERTFRTPEYFCYDPNSGLLEGWRLQNGHYQDIIANERGWLWSEELQLWLGTWVGTFQGDEATWLRFYDAQGQLVLIGGEAERKRADDEQKRADDQQKRADDEQKRADEQQKRAEDEQKRTDAAQAELARLKALLAQKGVTLERRKTMLPSV